MNERTPLFRPEVTRRESWLGEVSVVQPPAASLAAGFAVLAAALVVALLACGEYSRRSRVGGQLVPDLGMVTAAAPVSGTARGPAAGEGTQVEAGETLLAIVTPRSTRGGDTTAALLAALDRRGAAVRASHEAEAALLATRLEGLRENLAAARAELELAVVSVQAEERRLDEARSRLVRFRRLAAAGHASALAVSEREQAVLQQTSALKAGEREASAAGRTVSGIEQALREIDAERAALAAGLSRSLAELEQERTSIAAGGEVLVQAPVAGLVATRLIEPGQSVEAGQPLFALLPRGSQLLAQLLVPSRGIGFVSPGDAVLLRYLAYPHEKFGHYRGRVLSVSRNALGARELQVLVGRAEGAEPHYRVLVSLPRQQVVAYGRPQPLLPGMRVEADILGERRRLYEWVLEPLYALRGAP